MTEDGAPKQNNEGEVTEVKPVKLSRWATVGILIACVIGVLILVLTIHSCNIEKKVESSQNTTETKIVSEVSTETAQNVVEMPPEQTEKPTVVQEVTTTPTELTTDAKAETSVKVDVSSSGLNEVALPELSEKLNTNGIVVSKKSYKYEGSYIYGVTVSMLVGEQTKSVQYFCPKNTYDALSSTDTITVEYQLDSGGNISISSISK